MKIPPNPAMNAKAAKYFHCALSFMTMYAEQAKHRRHGETAISIDKANI
jgi:hypothetical protein